MSGSAQLVSRVPDVATRRIIAAWIANLAKITRHKQGKLNDDELAALKEERAIYAELLAKDLPSGAFTLDSLHAVVQGHSYFPPYDEIRSRVQAWWNENRPASAPRLQGPDGARLSVEDASWLAFYTKRRKEILDKPGSMNLPDPHREPLAYAATDLGRLDSFVRRHSPGAWKIICGPSASEDEFAPQEAEPKPDALADMADGQW